MNLKPRADKKKEEPKLDADGNPPEPMHDRAFKPGGPKKSIFPTIEKFPEYKPDPPKQLKRKVVVEGEEEDDRPGFKMTHNHKTRPIVSVATHFRNLKASYPSAFRSNSIK